MATTSYDIGDVVRVSATFTVSDELTDPTDLVFKTKSPIGTATTYTHGVDTELVRDMAGTYHVDVHPSDVGKWEYRWEATGDAVASEGGRFYVRRSNL